MPGLGGVLAAAVYLERMAPGGQLRRRAAAPPSNVMKTRRLMFPVYSLNAVLGNCLTELFAASVATCGSSFTHVSL